MNKFIKWKINGLLMKLVRIRICLLTIIGALLLSMIIAPVNSGINSIEEVNGTPPGWSDGIPLSDYDLTNQYCSIATNNDAVHVIWRHNYTDLVHSKSSDDGRTWSAFSSIYHNDAGTLLYDDIAVSEQMVHAVVGDFDGWDGIYYINSTDNGDTWNNARRISSNGVDTSAPHIFINYSNLHIIWNDWRDGANGEAYYRRSLDGGITFDDGQEVDQDRRISFSSSVVTAPRIAGYESNISVAWMDERNGDFDLYWMISKDNGDTWEDGLGNVGLDRRLSFTGVLDYSISVNGSNIHIVWSNEEWPGPVHRLYYINSTDNGATWNTPQLLAGPTPLINSPDIDVVGDNVHIVWDDERDDGTHAEIYYKNSTDGGISWSTDLRLSYNLSRWSYWPRISVANNTKHIVWWDQIAPTNHQIMYKRFPDFPIESTYNITLTEGWNLISTPLIQPDESIDKVLENITGKWNVVKYYDTTDADDPWKTYRVGASTNDLANIDETMGFWINITEQNVNLTVSGTEPSSTSITLYAGWNLVGYPTQTTETVANALWGTGCDRVEVFNATEPYLIKEVEATYVMKPGEGYWVHVPADSTWTVDW